MSTPRLKPPQDDAPQLSEPLKGGERVDLVVLAAEICRRYRREFPDEQLRYGDLGQAWCRHDIQHQLNWAVDAVNGDLDMHQEVAWLANVLQARDFPTERLARSLDIGADVVLTTVWGDPGEELAAVLATAAAFVRSGEYIDYVPEE